MHVMYTGFVKLSSTVLELCYKISVILAIPEMHSPTDGQTRHHDNKTDMYKKLSSTVSETVNFIILAICFHGKKQNIKNETVA